VYNIGTDEVSEVYMSEKVLIFNGSPRKEGNSSFLAGKVLEGIREANNDAEVEVFNLHTMHIEPCRACNGCRAKNRKRPYCIINDDMKDIYEKVASCKAIVLVSPIYWFTVTAQMKLFMDRLYGLNVEETNSLKDKPVGIVLVYGDVDPYVSGAVNAIGILKDTFGYMSSKISGIVYGTASDIGDAKKNVDLCEKAFNLGKTLL
jgi:multimeric flavodoxin WrbA